MIADTQIAGTELLAASAQLQSALASARARLVRVARLTLVASILPVTVFIGWLAATEPSIMIGSALVLALWIGCDHGQEGALAAKPAPRMRSLRGPAERASGSDRRATTAWA